MQLRRSNFINFDVADSNYMIMKEVMEQYLYKITLSSKYKSHVILYANVFAESES